MCGFLQASLVGYLMAKTIRHLAPAGKCICSWSFQLKMTYSGGSLHTNHEGEVVAPEPGCRPPVAQTRSKTCRNIVQAILKDESEQKESRIKKHYSM